MLIYDRRSRCFVGTRYLVAADAFIDRVSRRCRGGERVRDALNQLRFERAWSLEMAGAEPVFTAATLVEDAVTILASVRRTAP